MALDSGEYNVNSKCTDETAIVALDLMADDQVTALPRVGDRVFSSFDVGGLRLKRRQSGNIEGSSNGDDLMEPTQTSIRRKRKDSSDKVEFAKRPRTTQSQHLDPSDPAIEIIDQTRNSTEKLVLHRIYEFIDQKGVSGVSLKDIHPNFPDLESDSLQNAIKKLNSTVLNASDPDVSVINRVGFSSHRFVTHKWIKTWTLGPVVSSASISSSDSRVDTRFGKARLWYDIRGKVVDWILHVSLRSVLSYIVMFPGIKMSVLQTQLTSAFCKAEVIELVEMLIEKKLVREKRLTIPKRPTSIWDDDAFDAGIHDIGNDNFVIMRCANICNICD
ncbi:hypothetical protein HK098_002237 [Nowakowskiella sp. JEL0407]|nr:hypothetical protein HK098_002237 [Nowakowskiella sp. JEL0407]